MNGKNMQSTVSVPNSNLLTTTTTVVSSSSDDVSREWWRPNEQQYQDYAEREVATARSNIRLCLRQNDALALKDLREITLHTVDTLNRALFLEIEAGRMHNKQGKYHLVFV